MYESIYGSFSSFLLPCRLAARLAPKCFPIDLTTPSPSHCLRALSRDSVNENKCIYVSLFIPFTHTCCKKVIRDNAAFNTTEYFCVFSEQVVLLQHSLPCATPEEQEQNAIAAYKMFGVLRCQDSSSVNAGACESCHSRILGLETQGNIPYVRIPTYSRRVAQMGGFRAIFWWQKIPQCLSSQHL